jgi:hypothetical protein
LLINQDPVYELPELAHEPASRRGDVWIFGDFAAVAGSAKDEVDFSKPKAYRSVAEIGAVRRRISAYRWTVAFKRRGRFRRRPPSLRNQPKTK